MQLLVGTDAGTGVRGHVQVWGGILLFSPTVWAGWGHGGGDEGHTHTHTHTHRNAHTHTHTHRNTHRNVHANVAPTL